MPPGLVQQSVRRWSGEQCRHEQHVVATHFGGESTGLGMDGRDRLGVGETRGGEPPRGSSPMCWARIRFRGCSSQMLPGQFVQLRVAHGVQHRDGVGDRIRVDRGRPGLDVDAPGCPAGRPVASTAATHLGVDPVGGNGDAVAIRMRCGSTGSGRRLRGRTTSGMAALYGITGCGSRDDVQQSRAVAHGAGEGVTRSPGPRVRGRRRGEGRPPAPRFETDDAATL